MKHIFNGETPACIQCGCQRSGTLTVLGVQCEAYMTACEKGWHDEDSQPPSAAIRFIAQGGLQNAAIARWTEMYRKGQEPPKSTSMYEGLNELSLRGLDDRQVRVIARLALVNTEVAEAIEDVIAGRWGTTTNEKGKPEGLGSELADIIIRVCDDASALGVDLEAELRAKLAYNRTRPHRHGGNLA